MNRQPTTGVMAQSPDPIQAKILPLTNQTSLILVGGLVLMGLNFGASGTTGPRTSVLDLGLQAGGLVLLLLIASVSPEGGTFAVLLIAALWLGYLYSHRATIAQVGKLTGNLAGAVPANGSAPAK